MVEKICRLCFTKKTRLIGLFTARGVKLNAATVIRTHFPDEVKEDDLLPQTVCTMCWKRLANFHEFYKAVDEAKLIYLKNNVKEEVPIFTEIDCDSFRCDDDILSVKVEPMEMVDVKLETDPSPTDDTTGVILSSLPQEDVHGGESDSNHSNDKIDKTECVQNYDDGLALDRAVASSVAAAAKLSQNNALKANDKNLSATDKNRSVNEHLEILVPNYMEMTCEICKHPFESLAMANAHYRHDHNQRGIIVKCCQKRVDLYDVYEHIQYHLDPDIFKCPECSKTFMLKRVLRNHLKSHLPKTFECDVCKKKFPTRSIIKTHILVVHGGEKQKRTCEICHKIFVTKYSLNSHVKLVHQRHYQQVCHICAKVYSTSTSFRQHMKEHSDVKDPRVVCQICGRSYKNPKGLRSHMATHKEEDQCFKCPQCPKISPNRHALTAHIRVMHNFKVHKCHLCERECKSAVALTEHVATHTGEYLYNCIYCTKKFKSHSNMYQHFRDSHPMEWSADRKTKPRENHRRIETALDSLY